MKGIFLFLIVLLILASFASYKQAYHGAKVYNEKYGTSYSVSDFFWAKQDIVDRIHGGIQETKNYNINGAIPIKVVK